MQANESDDDQMENVYLCKSEVNEKKCLVFKKEVINIFLNSV